ncbi:division/cell wall cluster transcriptional repressor MraZ [Candidatus Kaiserbacteria bacterium CG_4_8_14_3_um_filter_50_23]|nr:MAG: division/cell wall cluster transcriptional repressor MraZ [Parcubacteria group bacterium CG1_02_50_68]PIW96359.1 MAG: division/cell wall cluster transcriptional repressor MraZ [Candidatus Kaiserbacteria bacterium CG_4_8_14_3_um_filter_50_23]PJA00688.1 MAG: division/cell wall cluster transcriptional repressor MraZ [Candidatus Kaiserbacteria bacterium CG_4_10_14_0_2_um_filter_50_16]
MFLGEYLHTFDSKNRISVPSKFRKDLGRVVVVTRGLDHCLYVYSRKAWEKEARAYADEVNGNAARRGLARLFLAGSAEAEVDRSGRVLIPEHLKSFASIGEKAVIAGVADRVEIWEESAWKEYMSAIERNADTFAETLGKSASDRN